MQVSERPSGWGFVQADQTLVRPKLHDDSTFLSLETEPKNPNDSGPGLTMWAPTEDTPEAHFSVNANDQNGKYQGESFTAKKDGTVAVKNPDFADENPPKLEALGPAKDGKQTYKLSFGQEQYTVVNDKGRLAISEDQGVQGKSDAGDWSATMDEQGKINFQAVDAQNKSVQVTHASVQEIADKEAQAILDLAKQGKHDEAAAEYTDFVQNGALEVDRSEGYRHLNRDQALAQFKHEFSDTLLKKGNFDVSRGGVFDNNMLKAMGFDNAAINLLRMTSKVNIDPSGLLNSEDKWMSQLEIVHAVHDQKNMPGSLTDWVNSWAQKGEMHTLTSKATDLYDESEGKIADDYESDRQADYFLLQHPADGQHVLDVAKQVHDELERWDFNVDESKVTRLVEGLTEEQHKIFQSGYSAISDSSFGYDLRHEGDFSEREQDRLSTLTSPYGYSHYGSGSS